MRAQEESEKYIIEPNVALYSPKYLDYGFSIISEAIIPW